MASVTGLLSMWLARQLPEERRRWLEDRLEALGPAAGERELGVALGLVPRRLGKDDLALLEADLRHADEARPGWDPRQLSIDQAARILLLLCAGGAGEAFALRFRRLCRTADVGEAIALYRGLPLYPDPERLADQAAEGARSNMQAVFEAVAHRSPFPRERFDQQRWNHMVLKALFVGSRLHPIQGLDERANPELAAMLVDYARERRAAGRSVSPELWRCVGPFAGGEAIAELGYVLGAGSEVERAAAALALAASPAIEAQALLAAHPDLRAAIDGATLSWERLAAGHAAPQA